MVPPNVVTPVPPLPTGRVPVTSDVRSTFELDRTPEALECIIPAPNPERTISPVEVLPMVSVCLLVVAKVPPPVMYRLLLPEFAEMEAVGIPLATFRNANFDEVVAVPPRERSKVLENGERSPLLICQ